MDSRAAKYANILMIFLLLGLMTSTEKLFGQEEERSNLHTIEQVSPNTGNNEDILIQNGYLYGDDLYPPDQGLPVHIMTTPILNTPSLRNELTGVGGNYIELDILGHNNSIEAIQQGHHNFMDLGIHASDSRENQFVQTGDHNYIFDRVTSQGIHHEIYQEGNHFVVQNRGWQKVPMIIHQHTPVEGGSGMKIIITGRPSFY